MPGVLTRRRVDAASAAASAGTVATSEALAASNGEAQQQQQKPLVVNIPEQRPSVLPPAAAYEGMVNAGAAKAAMPGPKIFLLGIMAGAYIAFGSLFMLGVGGLMPELMGSNPGLWKLVYALVYPVGLGMVVLGGGELFTGNNAVVASALIEKKCTLSGLAKNWLLSYAGNFVGSMLMVALVFGSGVLADNPMPAAAAANKCGLSFGVALVRGVLANWLVCIAVLQAGASSSLGGKMLAVWPPITTFIALGFEHAVANMFIVPIGILLGAKVTFAEFVVNNLIPVTIGNILAGVVGTSFLYAATFGVWAKPKGA